MTVNQKRLNVKNAAKHLASSAYKTRLSIVVAILIAFSCFTAFSTSQSKDYTIVDGSKNHTIVSTSSEIDDIVAEAGLKLNKNDIAAFKIDGENDTIVITRRCEINVSVYGESKSFVVEQDTVSNVLSMLGVTVSDKDTVTPALDTIVKDDTTLSVDKVSYKTKTSSDTITYSEYLALVKASNDASSLIEKTENEIKVSRTYKLTIVNGKQTDSALEKQTFKEVIPEEPETTDESEPEEDEKETTESSSKDTETSSKKETTTKKESNSYHSFDKSSAFSPLDFSNLKLDSNGVPSSYSKVISGAGTAYCDSGYTASGMPTGVGYVAVDPDIIPYGSKLYIRTSSGSFIYGCAVAADTGGFIHMGRVVDLYFNTESECESFGVQDVEVYVLN